MRRNGLILIGGFLIALGFFQIISQVFNINFWAICFPIGLILLGVFIIWRPKIFWPGPDAKFRPFGDIKRHGDWQVSDEEFYIFVGDIRLDLTRAEIPPGVTTIRAYGFVGDVELLIAQNTGLSISSFAFLTDSKIMDRKRDVFVSPLNYRSEGYESAERKVRIETYFFVHELVIDQI
jgi:lia operon protein LiaF